MWVSSSFKNESHSRSLLLQVEEAIVVIYQVWLAVIAVLTLKFAKTIALAASIAKFFQKHINSLTTKVSIPAGYEKWVPILVRW